MTFQWWWHFIYWLSSCCGAYANFTLWYIQLPTQCGSCKICVLKNRNKLTYKLTDWLSTDCRSVIWSKVPMVALAKNTHYKLCSYCRATKGWTKNQLIVLLLIGFISLVIWKLQKWFLYGWKVGILPFFLNTEHLLSNRCLSKLFGMP